MVKLLYWRGRVLTKTNILSMAVGRWTPNIKSLLLQAVSEGLVTEQEILGKFSISTDEFNGWKKSFCDFGLKGLKVTNQV